MKKAKKLWKAVVYAGTEGLREYEHKKNICLAVNLICLFIFLTDIVTGIIFYLISGKVILVIGCLAEAVAMFLLVALNYFRKYNTATISFYLLVNFATFYFGSLLGKAAEAQLMIVFLIGLVLFMFEKRSARIICIGITIGLLVLLELNFRYHFIIKPILVGETVNNLIRWIAYAVIIFLIIVIFYLYAKNNRLLLEKIQEYARQTELNLEKEKKSNQVKVAYIHNAYHEVRSSLFGVFVIIQCLSKIEKIENMKDWQKHIGHLRTGCENLKMVINNMLSYSKSEVGAKDPIYLEEVNLRFIFKSLVEIGQYSASEKQVKLILQVAETIPQYLMCDKVKLMQISTNLINNAIKFSRVESEIILAIERDEKNWSLKVKNEGQGISKERLETVFQAFSTEKKDRENQEGIGLGLHITNYLVGLLEGAVSVDSKVDCYTCFTVALPFLSAQEEHNKLQTAAQHHI